MADEVTLAPSPLMAPNEAGEVTLINPSTGEQVALSDAEDEQLGAFLDALDEWESRAKEARGLAAGEVRRRMDKDASWTRYAGPWKLTSSSPAPVESITEPDVLRRKLMRLADDGEISHDAAAAAVVESTVTTYSPQRSRLTALAKTSAKCARLIKRHTQTTERSNRPVKLTRRS